MLMLEGAPRHLQQVRAGRERQLRYVGGEELEDRDERDRLVFSGSRLPRGTVLRRRQVGLV
jgi:hypothetical protein